MKPPKPTAGPGSGRSGRRPGQTNAVSAAARAAAAAEGVLPHEWLLMVVRSTRPFTQRYLVTEVNEDTGVEVSRTWVEREYWPSWEERLEAAKAVVNFYAPKLAVHMLANSPPQGADAINAALKDLANRLPV